MFVLFTSRCLFVSAILVLLTIIAAAAYTRQISVKSLGPPAAGVSRAHSR